MDFCGVLAVQLQPLLLTNYPVFGSSFTHILERGNLVASTCFWLQMLLFGVPVSGCTGFGSRGLSEPTLNCLA